MPLIGIPRGSWIELRWPRVAQLSDSAGFAGLRAHADTSFFNIGRRRSENEAAASSCWWFSEVLKPVGWPPIVSTLRSAIQITRDPTVFVLAVAVHDALRPGRRRFAALGN